MKNSFNHTPVLIGECIEGLNLKDNSIILDGTLGGGGHSFKIAKHISKGLLIAIDKDEEAIEYSKNYLKIFNNIIFVKSDFKEFDKVLKDLKIDKVDGFLLDLGVSSYQIDTASRGFSYKFNGELDMRMDKSQVLSAYTVVNNYPVEDLIKIFFKYGEEQNARKIAQQIDKQRKIKPIKTTGDLVEIIEKSYPKKFNTGIGICKKVFQAIRIEVNGELDKLDKTLIKMVERLNVGGRICVITFHSLEDRIVKQTFKNLSTNCICDKRVPICTCNHIANIKLINKKPIIASISEQQLNKRSKSAKLRIVEKI